MLFALVLVKEISKRVWWILFFLHFVHGSNPFMRKGNHNSFVPSTTIIILSIGIYSSTIPLEFGGPGKGPATGLREQPSCESVTAGGGRRMMEIYFRTEGVVQILW
jgi:hypothetical protein